MASKMCPSSSYSKGIEMPLNFDKKNNKTKLKISNNIMINNAT